MTKVLKLISVFLIIFSTSCSSQQVVPKPIETPFNVSRSYKRLERKRERVARRAQRKNNRLYRKAQRPKIKVEREAEKAREKLRRAHVRKQTPEVRKRMKESLKESQRNNQRKRSSWAKKLKKGKGGC
ncbi:MAG: hypothetical protein JW783_09890 [Bacteroidales bacterium]|nr:hypothetical protein [Bacteroidales bacterium]MBN2749109.1 hypothetical protein [Bacteroidales bacterium]